MYASESSLSSQNSLRWPPNFAVGVGGPSFLNLRPSATGEQRDNQFYSSSF